MCVYATVYDEQALLLKLISKCNQLKVAFELTYLCDENEVKGVAIVAASLFDVYSHVKYVTVGILYCRFGSEN